jgi:hypothetical protein
VSVTANCLRQLNGLNLREIQFGDGQQSLSGWRIALYQPALTLTLRGSNPSVLRFDAPSAVLAAAERTVDRLWDRIGELMGAFFERDCQNFLTH